MPILLGRGFTPEEEVPNGPRVVVISQGSWERHFTNDSHILGKSLSLNGEPYRASKVDPLEALRYE